jgi:hypothetical protein
MPEELKELCEGELLMAGAEEACSAMRRPEDLKKICASVCAGDSGEDLCHCPFVSLVLL